MATLSRQIAARPENPDIERLEVRRDDFLTAIEAIGSRSAKH